MCRHAMFTYLVANVPTKARLWSSYNAKLFSDLNVPFYQAAVADRSENKDSAAIQMLCDQPIQKGSNTML